MIIYRSSSKYLAHSLLPLKQAQALHPAPYPDEVGRPSELDSDWKKQIYYAWWNGFILGYPEHFVDSYCETFHNGLGLEDKQKEITRAKHRSASYFGDMDTYSKAFKQCYESHENNIDHCSKALENSLNENRKTDEAAALSKNIKAIIHDSFRFMKANPDIKIKFEHVYIGFGNIAGGPLSGDFWKFINN